MTDLRNREVFEVVEDLDDIPTNPTNNTPFVDILDARMNRRDALKAGGTTAAAVAMTGVTVLATDAKADSHMVSTLTFEELEHGNDETHHVAPGYEVQTLIRWGDPVVPGAPEWDVNNQTAEAQEQQFGYNCDFVGYMPLPQGSDTADHGLLCVNHEYTNGHLMFAGVEKNNWDTYTKEITDVEIAAHGHTVVEIRRDADNKWSYVKDSPFNRRITASSTEMEITGPAAGHDRLKTNTDPTGTKVIGTLNNCAGGKTPWGTILFAEENFNGYFGGELADPAEQRSHDRYGISDSWYAWYLHHDRFNVGKDPHEPNKFGWMVEFDPYDPNSVPKKRTALGRFKHEGATVAVSHDGTIVAYTGDDQRFDYVYKFVSDKKFDPNNREANMDALDHGTLYVGKFNADGTLNWLPVVYGQGPLTEENDFASQADVLIETRRAADLLGATPMDRPEDVEPNPVTGVVYMALTNNSRRKEGQEDAANPRAPNRYGHIVEMIPPGTARDGDKANADHTADTFTWDIILKAGDPNNPEHAAEYHEQVSVNGWLSCPDNVAFDSKGRLWIATDGAPGTVGTADGVWATDVAGPGRALTRHFYRTPTGAEHCGPEFNTDDSAYFVAVQHPGDDKDSTFANPSTRWPDFQDGIPPRPSVQVIVKQGGGAIG